MGRRTARHFSSYALVAFLAGCISTPQEAGRTAITSLRPKPAPDLSQPAPTSAASQQVKLHFAKVQADLLSNGLLRSDGGGRDTPWTARMLTDNFIRIALFDEYALGPGGPVQRQTSSHLRRWEVPIRVGLRFGASVPEQTRSTDTARIKSYLARLARITGHSISLNESSPNFYIHIVNEDERRAIGPAATTALPGLRAGDVAGITNMPLSTYCLVYAMSEGSSGRYTRAFAVIRAEHPDLLRLSCMHEELAQGLGLANDSPRARPSIFNDDEEFALLTNMDEAMLRIPYNPALRPGMSEAEARPIVETLARSLTGGDS